MKFGYFDDAAKEYVITTPQTPQPWINYLGSRITGKSPGCWEGIRKRLWRMKKQPRWFKPS